MNNQKRLFVSFFIFGMILAFSVQASSASTNGYYRFPRKTNLKKLAKLMNVALPTYQEHLRKAEINLMPNFFKRLQFE